MGMIPPEKEKPEGLERGPWEGCYACSACHGDLSENAYYSNSSVCSHCGAREGLGLIVRRKVFRERVYKQPWWQRWLGVPENERGYRWEVKETDD